MEQNSPSLEELKKQLTEHLQEDNSDNNILLSLSHDIASLEKNKVRFSIDAGVIDRLGQELVARQETAVSELVKNSYDADATEVKLTFANSNSRGGSLEIEDNGDGMTRDELINGFMRISSTSKIHNPVSRLYKRKRAGQKGIGRFSVQRLGIKLTIITQTKNSENALQLTINWDRYKNDTNLLSISNELESTQKQIEHGTILIIDGLRDKWSKAAIKRIYRYVSNIIQPFSLAEVSGSDIDDNLDPGFKALFYKNEDGKIEKVADKGVMVYDHAVAQIEGHIDDSGIGIYTIDSKKLQINEIGEVGNSPDDPTQPFTKLKNVRFRAYYFIYDSKLIPRMHSTSIKRLAEKEGGIKLYRDGFRVLPYAEPGDDWLELDKSMRRRVILPPHGNNNFFGFVELKDKEQVFNETSSREGLMENEALRQLKNFIYRTLMTGVLKVASNRGSKGLASQKKAESGSWEAANIKIRNIALTIDELEKELDGSEGDKKKRRKKIKKIKEDIEELDAIQKSEIKRTIKERSMLRVLSSIGLTVAQFIHEIKHYLDHINGDIAYLMNTLDDNSKALTRLNILKSNFDLFNNYTSYYDSVISANVINDLMPLSMHVIAKDFVKAMTGDAERASINFDELKFNRDWLYTKPMHPSEWSSILFNFYTNSKKAIRRKQSEGKIKIECGEDNELIFLEFSDNGDGISEEAEDKVFDEFYTTTNSESLENLNENTEKLGTGLGLKIVKDIVKGYRGTIKVVSPKGEYSTCIRIEVGKASEKDINKYGL